MPDFLVFSALFRLLHTLFFYENPLFSGIIEASEKGGKAVANSSKDLQLRELKDMITELRNMIKTLQATVDAASKREEVLIQERDNLKDEISLLRKKLLVPQVKTCD